MAKSATADAEPTAAEPTTAELAQHVKDLQDKLQFLLHQKDNHEELRVNMAKLTAMHAEVVQQLGKITQVPEPQEARMMRILAAQDEAIISIERELAEGPRKFRVILSGEPLMDRIVGSTDESNAIKKYKKHFGIIAVVDYKKEFQVEDLGTEAPPIEEWPARQREPVQAWLRRSKPEAVAAK